MSTDYKEDAFQMGLSIKHAAQMLGVLRTSETTIEELSEGIDERIAEIKKFLHNVSYLRFDNRVGLMNTITKAQDLLDEMEPK